MPQSMTRTTPWDALAGPNLAYIQDQYEQFRAAPDSVEPELARLFQEWGPPPEPGAQKTEAALERETEAAYKREGTAGFEASLLRDSDRLERAVQAEKMVWYIRTYGHLAANIDPLADEKERDPAFLEPEAFGLTRADLETIPARLLWEDTPPEGVVNGWDAIQKLRTIYTQTAAFQYGHVHETAERKWLKRKIESGYVGGRLKVPERKELLRRLAQVHGFEQFLHRTFTGQKRFSIEGLDVLVPMLDEIIRRVARTGARNILMGMAHRGRLNVLAHVLQKPYDLIFSEFRSSPDKELVPSEGSMGINFGWTGDVKYHMGAERSVEEEGAGTIRLTLANNPSHLEFVNPVVEGYARAAQEEWDAPGFPRHDPSRALAVLVHGDAAFPGEGVVAETLNLSRLRGFHTGGTIHIIANNGLGFTTEPADARSTKYASDLAKGFEIPIIHVNADDPEACVLAVRLAMEYRETFKKDFLIDLIGYRRHGHNEMDDPAVTQPHMYGKIKRHPSVKEAYGRRLAAENTLDSDELGSMDRTVEERLQQAYDEMKEESGARKRPETDDSPLQAEDMPHTGVASEKLKTLNRELLLTPEGASIYPKLKRILQRREGALDEGGKIDWAHAETLAFATLLSEGFAIRLTGQDTERGTFAHRHLILHDPESGETWSPLHRLPQARASFAIHNSPLSEMSVLGFEYGYDVFSRNNLVLWEAQYGDFVNAAQVVIDQFLAAGRAKWGQKSNLVLLLPHGYEGQGPEHSSARLERFLQSSAENNWTIVNVTSAAQYFHLLRGQALRKTGEGARPLIVMAPKSLLRNPRTVSRPGELSEEKFMPIREQPGLGVRPGHVKRLILCSGKTALDLQEKLERETGGTPDDPVPEATETMEWLHIVRIEQLYPFPRTELRKVLDTLPNVQEVLWVQEEPKNMGAWSFVEPRLAALAPQGVKVRYGGRPYRSSPATGHPEAHQADQKRIVSEALDVDTLDEGGHRDD